MSRRARPGSRAIGISLGIHVLVLAPMIAFARTPAPIEFETIKINLVSPPPADAVQAQTEAPVVERQPEPEPEPPPPEPEPEPEVTVEEEKPPEPPKKEIEERPETEKPPEPPKTETQPKKTEAPEKAETGGEDLNIATEGREFPYPDYLNNVIVQVHRYFRWTGETRPRGTVYFEILPDGSVRNIRMARSSGNLRFDFAVQGAVETAGNRRAFGPLPEGFAAPFLPVQMAVEPPR